MQHAFCLTLTRSELDAIVDARIDAKLAALAGRPSARPQLPPLTDDPAVLEVVQRQAELTTHRHVAKGRAVESGCHVTPAMIGRKAAEGLATVLSAPELGTTFPTAAWLTLVESSGA